MFTNLPVISLLVAKIQHDDDDDDDDANDIIWIAQHHAVYYASYRMMEYDLEVFLFSGSYFVKRAFHLLCNNNHCFACNCDGELVENFDHKPDFYPHLLYAIHPFSSLLDQWFPNWGKISFFWVNTKCIYGIQTCLQVLLQFRHVYKICYNFVTKFVTCYNSDMFTKNP